MSLAAMRKTSAIIAAVMAESILLQVKEHVPGITEQRLKWFDGAFQKYSNWLNDGRPISSVVKKVLDKFESRFLEAAKAPGYQALPSPVQAMSVLEATNIILHDVPSCLPESYQAEAWRNVIKHHNAIIDKARLKLSDADVTAFESIGTEIYLAVAEYLIPENQDALLFGNNKD